MSLLTLLKRKRDTNPEIVFAVDFVDFSLVGDFSALTLSRASIGTSINDNPNLVLNAEDTPRLTADVNGTSLGLLIEPTRTNLLTHSDFDAAPPTGWGVGFGSGDFSIVPANWSFAGEFLAIDQTQQTLGRSFLTQNVAVQAGVTYTASVYVDPNQSFVSAGSETIFSVSGGTVPTVARTISDLDNQSRLSMQFTASADGNASIRIGVGTFGNATGRLVFVAPQVEEGDNATSWIPTTNTQLTRAADIATINLNTIGTTNPTVLLSSSLRENSGTLATYGALTITSNGNDVTFTPGGTLTNAYNPTGTQGFTANPLIISANGNTQTPGGSLTTNGILNLGRDTSNTNQTVRSVTILEPAANASQLTTLTQ